MGDSSIGKPSGSGIANMKDLLENTKKEYQAFHPKNKEWPCPFCFIKSKTLIQCRIHIYHEHRSIANADRFDFFSNIQSKTSVPLSSLSERSRPTLNRKCKQKECSITDDVEQESESNEIHKRKDHNLFNVKENMSRIGSHPESKSTKDSNVSTTDDLTKFLKLINDGTNKESVLGDELSTSSMHMADRSTELFEDDDEEVFYCPYDCTNKKPFRNRRGVNIHIGKVHQGKAKIKREDVEYVYITNESAETSDFGRKLAYFKTTTATLRRCPKGARQDLAVTLTKVIRKIVINNSENSWNDLLIFPYATLRIPDRSENVMNLTSFVRQNIKEWNEGNVNIIENTIIAQNNKKFENEISKKAEAKLSDGDISGALRLISSDDCIAPNNDHTLNALKHKHPEHPEPSNFPDSSIDVDQIIPTEEEVRRSIMSFKNGSAGGLDSLRPQILKDLLNIRNGEASNQLLSAITSLTEIILHGDVPASVCPYLYGAMLTALQKICGGIRPIAVGNTWRRISAKLACYRTSSTLSNLFKPNQLGVGIKNGAEAGAHTARIYFNHKHKSIKVFLKIDVKNAFNELRRDALLHEVKRNVPEIFKFVEQCYRNPTNVYYGEHLILSQRGVQQGDPLGPALFCLTIQRIIASLQLLNLDLNLWYLDDGTIAGHPHDVLLGLEMIIEKAREVGLELNHGKCEISILGSHSIDNSNEVVKMFQMVSPGIQEIREGNEFLLGSPLTDQASVICLEKKIIELQRLSNKLTKISAHSAYFLLRISITTPRLIFFLRGTPMWRNHVGLKRYDEVLKESLESLLNIQLTPKAWSESALPIKSGGIGIRHATEIALPCFLSSIYQVSDLVDDLLSEEYRQTDPPKSEAEELWCEEFGELPEEGLRRFQKIWELDAIKNKIDSLSTSFEKTEDKARFLANSITETGAWLQVLPSPQLGTHLSNDEFRIAMSLRLGTTIVQPHKCICGEKVTEFGRHGLSCSKAKGTKVRHAMVNNILQRSLRSAEVPAILEPPGCSRPDGKKPDGLTLIPWAKGKSLLWDYTCRDTFAPSYLSSTSKHAGHAAKKAEVDKIKRKRENSANFFNLDEYEEDDEETFYCPYDCKIKKAFLTLRGLNIHIGRKHPDKPKIKRNEISYEYIANASDDPTDFGQKLAFLRSTTATLRRCPKGARQDLAVSLTNVIRQAVNQNDEASWNNLLLFPYATLRIPSKDENVTNLTSFVRQNIKSWNSNEVNLVENFTQPSNNRQKGNEIYKKVEAKLADGDVSGALRLLSSDDCIAPKNEETLKSLQQKHPAHPEPTNFPDSSIEIDPFIPTEDEVQRSIMSFRNGTAGGLDSLRPQILKDLLNVQNGEVKNKLLTTLTSLMTIIISGTVPTSVCRYLYGATLTALQKLCGGIRPIAVGNTWRRIAAKLACRRGASILSNIFQTNQLGVGIKNGVEAGAHTARIYFNSKHKSVRVFLKIDFTNAFNEARRDVMLHEVKNNIPEIFKFVEQCYKYPTNIYYGENLLLSQRGVQQGDPLGPALFCLTIQRIISSLKLLNLDLNLWYLDDGSVAGMPEDVLNALNVIIEKAAEIGLELNYRKCEISVLGIGSGDQKCEIIEKFRNLFPGMQEMKMDNAFLLGSPLTDTSAIVCLGQKVNDLERMVEKMKNINAHSAYFLLKISISTPRLIFFLRGNPMWRNSPGLERYDAVLKESLESILNIQMTNRAWSESSLPIKHGGIGIRHATDIALPSFLSSIHEVSDLVEKLVSEPYRQIDPVMLEAERIWYEKFGELPEVRNIQRIWESNEITNKVDSISSSLKEKSDMARFKANSVHESGAWLQALPSPQLGTHLSNDEFRVALSLRLGVPIVRPYVCICGEKVNQYGHHGLSCSKANGTNPRHANGNNILQRALKSGLVPAILEPPGCSRPDGKKPDGMSLVPWARGRSLLWDFTCKDTFAPSYLNSSSKHAGYVAKVGERIKISHYSQLANQFIFIPVATETSGVIGKLGLDLIKKIGSKITDATNEKRATSYLIQRISIAIQKGNVASILGTIPPSKDLKEVFYLFTL